MKELDKHLNEKVYFIKLKLEKQYFEKLIFQIKLNFLRKM